MNQKIPKTPFATRLSGDAKETELRIRSIFSGKKLRPPVWIFTLIVLVMLGCIGLVSCKTEDDKLWAGLNARIVEIDTEQMILYVQDINENANVFGQRCALDCKQAAQEKRLIFVDYETHEVTDISFYEFQVGDEIIIELYSSQKEDAKDNAARAEQVQLGTQRPIYGKLIEIAEWYDDFFRNYQEEFEDYTYTGDTSYSSDDRTLVLEDIPENPAEQLLFASCFFNTTFEFWGLRGLQGSENLQMSVRNAAKNAAEGLYFQNITIHELAVLSKEDFTPGGKYFSDLKQVFEFVDQVNFFKDGHGLAEYTVVYADFSWQWSEEALEAGTWPENGRYERLYLVGKISERDSWHLFERFLGERVLGRTNSQQASINEIVPQKNEGEYDLEMSLWHDSDPNLVPLRLGEWNEGVFTYASEMPTVKILDGWEPIYWPGDYWDQYTREGINVLRYYHADGDYFSVFTIDMTRDDFITHRGIRVGDTKDAVKAAYPELKVGEYWGMYPGEDYFWYCEDSNDFGPALIFFFENNEVSRITLNNMFN